MTIRYFDKVKKRLEKLQWLTERLTIETEYDEDANTSNISGSITFIGGSIFHFKEVRIEDNRYYRFHFMDERNNLISRWDNAPHHKDLKTFPNHVHLPSGVNESKQVTLIDVLDIIETHIINSLD